ncbi:hypothetical protein ETAA8_36630 [Anatilimnocola aggregata]|uniref:Uncharacterized protein n=1 Tax=Anatilimnocola aggregata TaxID=2528021 RepID=A0A517YEA9_9BACT|nr:hypothetical protein [Anatilimnocola aggregata]QDU28560.1 hypothetical protein ETAA8_36630 [Anatilimnocola aggregata]
MPSLSTPRSGANAPRLSRSPTNNRLASAPDMFGDYFQTGGDLNFSPNFEGGSANQSFGTFTVPSAGGSRRVKIGENNRALPTDRLIFSYSHFQNALQFSETPFFGPGGPTTQLFPVDRYTLGIEKTFFDGTWSCEVRMPFQGAFDFQGTGIGGNGGQVGNLALILKHLLFVDEELAIVAGMGIDTPTGSNFTLTDFVSFPSSEITFQNDSLHLLPFIGMLWGGDRPYFINAFLQLDLAANGNRIDAGPVGGPATTLGLFNEQNLLFADLGTGYWLFQDEFNDGLTSLAAILELHYTSALQDTDIVVGNAGTRPITYTNNFNRFDILNVTAGFQAQFNNVTSVRVACVVPLLAGVDRRFFDNELQVQINHRF